jgi:hypothetical protein
MVLQRRREQHVLSDYDGEGLEFWQDELDAVAAEERAICDRLSQMEPEYDLASPATSTCITASGTLSSANPAEQYLVSHDDAWATQAAQFEADEDEEAAAQFAAMREYEYRVETAHGYGHDDWYGAAGANVASASANVNVNVNGHVNSDVDVDTDMELGPEDWAAIQAMEAAMDDAMDVE